MGFALEVASGEARARGKLEKKRFDAIVLNGTANLGRGGGRVHWIEPDATARPLPSGDKAKLARAILDATTALLGRP